MSGRRCMGGGSRLWGDIGIADVLEYVLNNGGVSSTRCSIGYDGRVDSMKSIG
jgi:hypothetical protein